MQVVYVLNVKLVVRASKTSLRCVIICIYEYSTIKFYIIMHVEEKTNLVYYVMITTCVKLMVYLLFSKFKTNVFLEII